MLVVMQPPRPSEDQALTTARQVFEASKAVCRTIDAIAFDKMIEGSRQ